VRALFASRFRQALADAGYGGSRLSELGLLFGVTGQAVRKWLDEEALPRSSRAGEIASKLGVRRAWLLDGEQPMRLVRMHSAEPRETCARCVLTREEGLSLSVAEYRLLGNYRSLPGNLQQSVTALLEAISRELN
jgi:hypothetical protein